MNKLLKVLLLIILVLAIFTFLQFTNPEKEDFIEWAVQQSHQENDSELENIVDNIITRPVLTVTTSKKSYYIFSVFTIDNVNEEAVYIGFLNNLFIRIK